MKKTSLLLMLVVVVLATSFKIPDLAPGRTLNLFYVDNSYSKTYEGFGEEMIAIVDKKVDSLKNDKFSNIAFYLSDGAKNSFASNYNGAKIYIQKLSDGSTNAPNTSFDKSSIIDDLLTTDLTNIKNVNINLFITEAGLINDCLVGSNAGILINSFPRELQYLLKCNEEDIRVVLYYPAASTKILKKQLELFTSFGEGYNDFESKITFKFQPI